ncbi:MAG: PIG-L deacetylase family protein [Microthrixaceae bacterium]
MTPLDPPRRALAIGAHPDDVEFCCGATVARWARSDTVLGHVVLTDGSKGTWDAAADIEALIARRAAEQAEAHRLLGGRGDLFMLGRVDGELHHDRQTVGEVARIIREFRPDIVIGHDPWKRYRLHPDHRAAGFVTVDAVVAARDPHFFPEHGLPPHRPSALLLFEADEANHLEPTDEAATSAKLAALEAHASQHETTHFYALDESGTDPMEGFRRRERQRMVEAAASLDGAGVMGPGEAFHLIDEL